MLLVVITEDVFTERLDLSDHIPALVVCDVFLDVIHDPEKQFVGAFQTFYQFIHSLLFHLIIVQPDTQVGCEVEFSCQISQDTLKEGVDGFYSEIVVVVDEQAQSLFRILSDLFFRKMGECGMYLYQILI